MLGEFFLDANQSLVVVLTFNSLKLEENVLDVDTFLSRSPVLQVTHSVKTGTGDQCSYLRGIRPCFTKI